MDIDSLNTMDECEKQSGKRKKSHAGYILISFFSFVTRKGKAW